MTIIESNLVATRKIFPEIDPIAIQHPLDRMATEQLKKLRGFDLIVAKYIEFRFERLHYVLNTASNVRVSAKQMPSLYKMLQEGCAILDMPEPELYVSQIAEVNAFTFGHTKPYIVVYAGLLEVMDDDEVMAVIAHELGHIKCGHVLYHTMASQIDSIVATIKDLLPAVGTLIGTGVDLALKLALLNWVRRSELSADRAALLVMQEPKSCIKMLAKLAGGTSKYASQLDPAEFLQQAHAYAEDQSLGNRFYRLFANMYKSTHPFAVERAKYLNDWIDSPEYDQILAGNYPRILKKIQAPSSLGKPSGKKGCTNCGRQLTLEDKFCASCGHIAV